MHTWGQALTYHPHVHVLVPAGGFDSDLIEWVRSGKKFFASVKVLSALFRRIFAENIYKHEKDLKSTDKPSYRMPIEKFGIVQLVFIHNLL